MPEISERNFEETIERTLLQFGPDAYEGIQPGCAKQPIRDGDFVPGGYRKRSHKDYDRDPCLIPRDVLDFILATHMICKKPAFCYLGKALLVNEKSERSGSRIIWLHC